MNALSVSWWGVVALISLGNAGLAQPNASKPEVVGIPGIGALLPRQAGSKDAPDISISKENTFELQSGTSKPWVDESAGTPSGAGGAGSPKQSPRR
jgi:hypothetical protein